MSATLNRAQLIGNVTKDPEVRTIPSGKKVANFSLATNESYTDKNGTKVDKGEFHRLVVWDKLAEIVEKYVKKGDSLYVEGKLATRSWDDDQGNKKYSTEIIVDKLQMLGGKGETASSVPSTPVEPIPDESSFPELPF